MKFPVFITAFPSEAHLESSLSCTGLHWWLDFLVFLTILYMLHLDLLMAKKAFFFFFKETKLSRNHEDILKLTYA